MLRPVAALIFASSVAFAQNPSLTAPATLPVTFSTHGSPEIWKHTTALLEVLPQQTASLGR